MEWWFAYLLIGAIVGFLAGLLGIGGGMIIVPLLVFVFSAKGFPETILMHEALGTAMATILFTSISSVRAHHQHGGVDWPIARAIAPGILLGGFFAPALAAQVPTRPLAMFFTAFMFYAATQMFFRMQPKATRELPGPRGLFAVGGIIGILSSLLAAGGAFLSIPFMTWCKVPLRRAIGTAAAIGFPIAAAGTIGYVLNGMRIEPLPAWSLGFVYLPALGLIVVTSMLAAPLGARLAHVMPVAKLRFVFALLLYGIGLRMLWTLW
jgi:uncharacterized membrane protein YfcA